MVKVIRVIVWIIGITIIETGGGFANRIYQHWAYDYSTEVEGVVTNIYVENTQIRHCKKKLVINYSYEVESVNYSSNRIWNNKHCINKLPSRYRELKSGDTVTVYVDSKRHTSAILDHKGPNTRDYIFVFAYGLMLYVFLFTRKE